MMEYTKTNWRDLPDTTTPITADRLNNMENGIEYLFEHGVGGGDTLPIGIILPFSDDNIPEGYMLCDGSPISRTTYATLFSVIGTTYGVGDGSTTFNIPNLKGRVPVGYDSTDNDFDTLGETGGEKAHVLTTAEMPNHAHTFQFDQTAGSMADVIKTGAQSSYGKATSAVGGGEAHNNLQPYQVINYIIKVLNAQNGEVRSESLPIGTELDYDGNTVPTGWERIEDNAIRIWLNSNASQSITQFTQNLDIDNALSNEYDMLEVFFQQSTSNYITYSSRFLKSSGKTRCFVPTLDGILFRQIEIDFSNNTITINSIQGNQKNDATLCIPICVIAYKTNLMNIQ